MISRDGAKLSFRVAVQFPTSGCSGPPRFFLDSIAVCAANSRVIPRERKRERDRFLSLDLPGTVRAAQRTRRVQDFRSGKRLKRERAPIADVGDSDLALHAQTIFFSELVLIVGDRSTRRKRWRNTCTLSSRVNCPIKITTRQQYAAPEQRGGQASKRTRATGQIKIKNAFSSRIALITG